VPTTQVWERVFVGSLHDAGDLARSNPHRITTAISLCSEPIRVKSFGLNYVQFPLADNRGILVGEFERIIHAIGENVRRGRVLVHSYGGMIRSPIVTAAWMRVCGYKSIDDALLEIAAICSIISTESNALLVSIRRRLRRTQSQSSYLSDT
jgi:protein-tyrosine phosphatase